MGEEDSDPKRLISILNKRLYTKGDLFIPGTGFCLKDNEKVYLSPQGLNADFVKPADIFTFHQTVNESLLPDVIEFPENRNLEMSKYSKLYLYLLEEFESSCMLLAQPDCVSLICDLFKSTIVFTKDDCMPEIKKIGSEDNLKPWEAIKMSIIEDVTDLTDLKVIKNIIKEIHNNRPSLGCLIKGIGLVLLGNSWMEVRTAFQCVKQMMKTRIQLVNLQVRTNLEEQISPIMTKLMEQVYNRFVENYKNNSDEDTEKRANKKAERCPKERDTSIVEKAEKHVKEQKSSKKRAIENRVQEEGATTFDLKLCRLQL